MFTNNERDFNLAVKRPLCCAYSLIPCAVENRHVFPNNGRAQRRTRNRRSRCCESLVPNLMCEHIVCFLFQAKKTYTTAAFPKHNMRCIWHEGYSPMNECIQNGRKFKCRSCYNSERFCQKKFKQDNKSHEWQGMTVEQKRECILENRTNVQQGTKRQYKVKEATSVQDSVKTGAQIPFLNKLELLGSFVMYVRV